MQNVIALPKILLPKRRDSRSMYAWSVIACDQFTSDKKYWQRVEEEVGDAPSTLKIIFPEVYLKENVAERIADIRRNMEKYLADGVLEKLPAGFVFLERTTRYTQEKRYGVMLAVDLDAYSFAPKSDLPIRATEATVPERIPPRVQIRRGAKLEVPHAMLLFNGSEREVFASVDTDQCELLYDFDLNENGGHLRGWALGRESSERVARALYGTASGNFLFAVGDGNHSLATAKTCWEEMKATLSEEERQTHPARYALAEAVSIYSKALVFEPIYRFVSGVDRAAFMQDFPLPVREEAAGLYAFDGEYDVAETLRSLDGYIARYLRERGGDVDYIHGKRELTALVAERADGVGFLLKAIPKDGFFESIEKGGSLPRKTFSMGEGAEKRYYTECKEIG